jgi:hypothetical protein
MDRGRQTPSRTGDTGVSLSAPGLPDADALQQEIELRAYYRYCERGCVPSDDVDDWVAAEREVLALHASRVRSAANTVSDARRPSKRRRPRQ